MNIRINRLTLQNFKGIKDASFEFNGHNCRVIGDNGTGKSTIFDAFTWLLFGKDHRGNDQTNFDIKTIDPMTRKPIEKLDHSVEAELLVDGNKRTLKRTWRENWVKPRGEVEQKMSGHTSVFEVDGVDVGTKKNYDSIIAQWVDEGLFRLITDPQYFIGPKTDWKSRRQMLLSLIDGCIDKSAILDKYSELIKEMDGTSVEIFRKKINAAKRENKARLEETEVKIKAWKEAMPEKVDVSKVRQEMESLDKAEEEDTLTARREMETLVRMATEASERQAAINKRLDEIREEKNVIRQKMNSYVEDFSREDIQKYKAHRAKIAELERKKHDVVLNINTISFGKKSTQADLERLSIKRQEATQKLNELGRLYKEEKGKAIDCTYNTICPTCGQPLPDEMREYNLLKAKKAQEENVRRIYQDAMVIKENIENLKTLIEKANAEIAECEKTEMELQAERISIDAEITELSAEPIQDIEDIELRAMNTLPYKSMSEKIQSLDYENNNLTSKMDLNNNVSISIQKKQAEIDAIRDNYEKKRLELSKRIVANNHRTNMQEMIDEANSKVKAYAAEIARLENLEYQVSMYIKDDIECQEGAINSLFKIARWKMFDTTIDGGIIECCEVINKEDGASYMSMNDAARIQCGMDCIRVMSDKAGSYVPVFIDNAESITQTDFAMDSQVIRLIVEKDALLTVINEEV